METVIIAILVLALMLVGALLIWQTTLSSVDLLAQSWEEMGARSGEQARTETSVSGHGAHRYTLHRPNAMLRTDRAANWRKSGTSDAGSPS